MAQRPTVTQMSRKFKSHAFTAWVNDIRSVITTLVINNDMQKLVSLFLCKSHLQSSYVHVKLVGRSVEKNRMRYRNINNLQ